MNGITPEQQAHIDYLQTPQGREEAAMRQSIRNYKTAEATYAALHAAMPKVYGPWQDLTSEDRVKYRDWGGIVYEETFSHGFEPEVRIHSIERGVELTFALVAQALCMDTRFAYGHD